ncbi:MAG: hypothetical protein Q8P61_07495 [Candidatus Nanopelagicales bacterium]|nr:hypothetical protein [Candidatus Nanopelagicales bacterium]
MAAHDTTAIQAGLPESVPHDAPPRNRRRREAPARDLAYDHLSLSGLRELRRELWSEEGRVSYWRRILQAKLDLIVDGATRSGATTDALSRILNGHLGRSRRSGLTQIQPVEGGEPIADVERLWNMLADGDTEPKELVEALRDAETVLSRRRAEIHQEIDRVTGQLIARYRENPALVFSALPARVGAGHRF